MSKGKIAAVSLAFAFALTACEPKRIDAQQGAGVDPLAPNTGAPAGVVPLDQPGEFGEPGTAITPFATPAPAPTPPLGQAPGISQPAPGGGADTTLPPQVSPGLPQPQPGLPQSGTTNQ